MLSNFKSFSYNGQNINQRADGFINLTQMCKANGKRIDNFLRLKQTQDYIRALTQSLQCEVLISVNGGNVEDIGTWGHPSLAINLARWISSDFAVWCDAHIFNLMSAGSTSLAIDPLEEMKLKIEFEKVQMAKYQAEYNLHSFRHSIVTMCPEPVQQKILGYQVVKEVERVEVIVDRNTGKTYDGVNITYITKSLGFPSTASCWKWLESVGYGKNSGKWETQLSAITNQKLNRNDFDTIKEIYKDSDDRQSFIGEY